MAFRLALTLLMSGLIWSVGCKKPSAAAPPDPKSVSPEPPQLHMNQAQPKLPTVKLWLGSQELETEVARSTAQVATGMMFREKIAENEAMLFVFTDVGPRSFYMKNTRVPLSVAYIDPQGTILEIHDLKPLDESPVFSKSDRVQYALETAQGWFTRHDVPVGTTVRTERGSLYQSFFKR